MRLDLKTKCAVDSTTIPNGININAIRTGKQTTWPETEPFKMVQVSRLLHEVKGQHILLFALRELIDTYQFTNFQLDFIGAGPSMEWLKALTHKLKLEHYCHFLGEQSRETVYENLANYHLLIQPSIFEGFGLTLVEAMTAKVLVLASNIDAPKEVTQNGEYGLLFEKNDHKHLAQSIHSITQDYNQNSIQSIIQKAYRAAKLNFNTEDTAQKYIDHYHNTSTKHRG